MSDSVQNKWLLEDEANLVAKAVGEPVAFALLFEHYFPMVHKYVLYRINDPHTTDDLVSQVFEKVLTSLIKYRPTQAPFGAWIFGIARHAVSDYYRSQKRMHWFSFEHFPQLAANDPPLETTTIRSEEDHQILCALSKLPDREKDLISLKFAGGLNNRQIARITGLSESHVGVILYRALQILRKSLEKEVSYDD
jgi:RNA polymerase sigma-70 factor (ECF subfamily)